MREHWWLADLGVVFDAGQAMRQPIWQAKIDCFANIEAVVEACVVCARQSDDELAGSLIAS